MDRQKLFELIGETAFSHYEVRLELQRKIAALEAEKADLDRQVSNLREMNGELTAQIEKLKQNEN